MIERARCPSPLFEFGLLCAAEWLSAHHNLLLEGAETSTAPVLRLVAPNLRAPVMWTRPGAPFELPASEVGALILEDVGGRSESSRVEQAQLLRWIEAILCAPRLSRRRRPPCLRSSNADTSTSRCITA